jgi:hypothetical protein
MEQEYIKVNAQFFIPKGSNIKTVIGSLWELYEISRISEEVEDEPVLFIVEERQREGKKTPEEIVEVGIDKKESLMEKLIG